MKIKYLLVIAVLTTAILGFGATNVYAAKVTGEGCLTVVSGTNYSIEERISCLQESIAQLMAQIKALQDQQGQGQTWCHTFNANIGVGQKTGNPEIKALIIALQKEGLLDEGITTDGYDETLASAVTGFQEKYASEILTPYNLKHGTGYLGKYTRAKLNALYGCEETSAPSIAISPTNLVRGGTYNFSGRLKNATPNSQIKFYLRSPDGTMQENGRYVGTTDSTGKFFLETTQTIYGGAQLGTYIGWVIVGDKKSNEVSFVVSLSSTSCTDSDGGLNPDVYGWTYVKSSSFELKHPDECAIVLDYDNNGNPVSYQSTDSCSGKNCYIQEAYCRTDENGNVIDADADKLINCPNGCSNGACVKSTTQPLITVTSPTANTTYIVGNTMPIVWKSSGVTGNVTIWRGSATGTFSMSAIKIATVPVSDGIYSWVVDKYAVGSNVIQIVSDSGITGTSNPFTVINSTQPSITVTSPNGGETWKVGEIHRITWSAVGYGLNSGVHLYLVENMGGVTAPCVYSITTLSREVSNQGIYNWQIPSEYSSDYCGSTQLAGKQFKIRASFSVDDYGWVQPSDDSNNYFTIAAASTQPSITVTSPNGGETWKVGESRQITWSQSGLKNTVAIGLVDFSTNTNGTMCIIDMNINSQTGNNFYQWTAGISRCSQNHTGNYKIIVYEQNSIASTLDYSDNYFTIAAATTSSISTQSQLASISSVLANIMQEIKLLMGQ